MRKKSEFKERYAEQLKNESLEKWIKSIFTEEEINGFYNSEEGLFQGLFKLFTEIYGSDNMARIYMKGESSNEILAYLNIKGKINNIITSAFEEYLSPLNINGTYVSFLWEALQFIMYNTVLKSKDIKIVKEGADGQYYINNKETGVCNGIFVQSVYFLKTPFQWTFEATLQDKPEIRHLIEKGSRKNHTLEILLGELIKEEKEKKFREFECYMIESCTNVCSAWVLYSIMDVFIECDSDSMIFDLIKELAYELGRINNLEVRIQVIYKIAEIVEIIKKDWNADISKSLKCVIEEVKEKRKIFNKNYDRLMYIILFLCSEEEKWKNILELVQGRNVCNFTRLRNVVIELVENVEEQPKSYLQMKFKRLWDTDNKSNRYRLFNCIWSGLQKGYIGK